MTNYFRLKQYLRENNINDKLHRFNFWLRNSIRKKKRSLIFEFLPIEQEYINEKLSEINYNKKENQFMKNIIFDFLYLNNESMRELKIFKLLKEDSTYIFQGKTNKVKVLVNY